MKKQYIMAFYNNLGGAFFATKDSFNPNVVHKNSASWWILPRYEKAKWAYHERTKTWYGYDCEDDMGFIALEIKNGKDKPSKKQWDALNEMMSQMRSGRQIEHLTIFGFLPQGRADLSP